MLRISMVCIAVLLFLSGCATYHNDSVERMKLLPQQYSEFDAKLAWQVTHVGGSTRIDGVVQNIRYYEMDELEIRVISLDAKGKELHQAADFIHRLKENEAAPFALKIPMAASGTKLRFMYHYIGNNGGGDSGDALQWRQSFEAVVP